MYISVCAKGRPEKRLYTASIIKLKINLITHSNWEIKKKFICHMKYKGHPRT